MKSPCDSFLVQSNVSSVRGLRPANLKEFNNETRVISFSRKTTVLNFDYLIC